MRRGCERPRSGRVTRALSAGCVVFLFALIGSSTASGTQYACNGSQQVIFNNWDGNLVSNGGTPPSFTTSVPYCIQEIDDYHWNDMNGATPGQLGLLDSSSNFVIGPSQATGSSGQGGAPNVNWTVDVNDTAIGPGTYTCYDSDHSTWSYDASRNTEGFCRVLGVPATVVNPPPPGPTVTSVSPSSGTTGGGTFVTVGGSGFSTSSGGTVFDFGFGNPASNVSCSSPSSCTMNAPAGSGTVDVLATVGGVTSSTSAADEFTYVAPPAVTSVTPANGPTGGGTSVTIGGSGFSTATGGTVFDFGPGNPASNVSCSSTSSCTATTPAGSGTVDVLATAGGLTSQLNAPADQFTYLAPPTVTQITPNVGSLFGSQVTITGTGFSTAVGGTTFDFGATPAATLNVSCSSSTSCKVFTPPASTPGTVDVTATVGTLTSAINAGDQFTYSAGPTVTSVMPNIGPIAGGTAVTIVGAGFSTTGGMNFDFGLGIGQATSVACTSSTTCTATAPSGNTSFDPVDVLADVGGNRSPANPPADQFTYQRATATVVTSDHDPSNPGQAVDFTATITPAPLLTPPPSAGTVGFSSDGTPIAGCTAVPIVPGVSGPLPQEAQATAVCTTTFPATGNHNITATFNPANAVFLPSTSAALNQVIANCGASLAGCNLKGVNLSGVNLQGANLKGDNLSGANLVGTNLNGANLNGANLSGASLQGANLDGATAQGANFKGANLSNAMLQGDFTGANLSGTTLTGANLSYAILFNANLSGVVAIGANFSGAHLLGANMSSSNFQNANFTSADLRQANLSNDYLAGANLSLADIGIPPTAQFFGANLTGANLSNLYGTPGNAFNKVIWSNTTCPDGTNSNADGGTCISNFL